MAIVMLSLFIFSYIFYTVLCAKIRYYSLSKQIPFIPSGLSNPVAQFMGGNGGDFLEDPLLFAKWHNKLNANIFGFNMGFKPRVIVFDKELTQLIGTSKHTADFEKTEDLRHMLRFLDKGIILQEGKEHGIVRKELQPVFNMANIEKMYPEFLSGSKKFVEKLKTVYPRNYPIVDDLQRCTLDIISKVAFDYDMNSLTCDSEVSKAFEAILVSVEFNLSMILEITFPKFAQMFSIFKFAERRNVKTVQNCIDDLIKKRITDGKDYNDLLSKCLTATKNSNASNKYESLARQLVTFLGAGHETTSSGLSWAIFALAKDQEIQDKLRQEIKDTLGDKEELSWDDIQSMKYLGNITSEVMRLYSPVTMILRQNMKTFTFKGVYYSKGTSFMIPIQDKHIDEEIFEDPLKFNPDRWDTVVTDSFTSLPFWTGSRGCIGKNLAVAEFKTILSVLFRHMNITISDKEEPERVVRITQKPKELAVNLKIIE